MKTYAFTIDAIGNDESYSIQGGPTSRVIIYEDNQAGTADYKVRMPLSTSPQLSKPAGSKLEILAPIYPGSSAPIQFTNGQVICYLSASSGSLNMVAEEY